MEGGLFSGGGGEYFRISFDSICFFVLRASEYFNVYEEHFIGLIFVFRTRRMCFENYKPKYRNNKSLILMV